MPSMQEVSSALGAPLIDSVRLFVMVCYGLIPTSAKERSDPLESWEGIRWEGEELV